MNDTLASSRSPKGYWLFEGSGGCGACKARSGYYTIYPGRPHKNCKCKIVYIPPNKKCVGRVSARGVGGGPRTIGGGRMEQDIEVSVEQPDGTTDTETITVNYPEDMKFEDRSNAVEDAIEDKGRKMSDPCPPILCV